MRHKLGKMSWEENVVSIFFFITILLWFTRADIDFGGFELKGWNRIFGAEAPYITDSTVAIAMAVLLFIIPSKNEKGKMLMSWEEAKKTSTWDHSFVWKWFCFGKRF